MTHAAFLDASLFFSCPLVITTSVFLNLDTICKAVRILVKCSEDRKSLSGYPTRNISPCSEVWIQTQIFKISLTEAWIILLLLLRLLQYFHFKECYLHQQSGRSGDRISASTRFSAHVHISPGVHPASCNWVARGVDHPPPSSAQIDEKSTTLPLLPLWAITTCSRVNLPSPRFR